MNDTPDTHDKGWYGRFNDRAAVWITTHVGTMTMFWVLTGVCLLILPSCLYAAGIISFDGFITSFGFNLLSTLILSTWLQAVLLPAIMVGQNLQNTASEQRAATQYVNVAEIRNEVQNLRNAVEALRIDRGG